MPSKKKLPSAVLIGLGLLLPAAYAQDLPMRQSPTWDGSNTAGGRPRQGYYPGIEQQELLQHQQVLQTWQDAERRSYETRVTPEHVLRDLQTKIQQCHNTGNFEGEANYCAPQDAVLMLAFQSGRPGLRGYPTAKWGLSH